MFDNHWVSPSSSGEVKMKLQLFKKVADQENKSLISSLDSSLIPFVVGSFFFLPNNVCSVMEKESRIKELR